MKTANAMARNPINNKKYNVLFHVVAKSRTPILGVRASIAVSITTINHENINTLSSYNSLNTIKEFSRAYKICKKIDAKPHASPSPIHYSIRDEN